MGTDSGQPRGYDDDSGDEYETHDCGEWTFYFDVNGAPKRSCPHYDGYVPDELLPHTLPPSVEDHKAWLEGQKASLIGDGGRIAAQMVIRAGKWKGHTLGYVYLQDAAWVRWLAAIDPAEYNSTDDWYVMRDAARALIRARSKHSGLECHACKGELRFRDVVIITADTLGVACRCSPNEPQRVNRETHPEQYSRMVKLLLAADSFEGLQIPYVAAEYPTLPCPTVDHEANRFTLAMRDVDDVETFMQRCARDCSK